MIVNGDFETPPPPQGGAPNWTIVGDMTRAGVVEEDGNRFLRLQQSQQGYLQVVQQFPVEAGWTGVKVSARVRVQDLRKGPEGHNTVTVLFTFKDAKGNHLGGWNQQMFSADQDWKAFEAVVDEIPEGATMLAIACSIMNASATADFDDVVVTPIAP